METRHLFLKKKFQKKLWKEKQAATLFATAVATVLAASASFPAYAQGINAGISAALASSLQDSLVAGQAVASAASGQEANDTVGAASSQEASDAAGAASGQGFSDAAGAASSQGASNAEDAGAEPQETICGYTNLGIANVENHLNIREGAGEEYDLVGKLPKDGGCEILSEEGDWYQIKSGKVTGYVKGEFLLTGEEAKAKAQEVKSTIATTNTQTVYLRTEPNTDCTIWTMVSEGEDLQVLEDMGDWIKVDLDGDVCYVFAELVELSEQLPKAMTMTEVRYGEGVSDVRVELVNYALQFVGNRYVYGGTSLTGGIDCSGFTMRIYEKYGISLPHKASAQAGYGTRISSSDARPGDLFFYSHGSGINHVAIYIGNGQVVHASNERTGIKISNAFYRTPTCVVSLLGN